MTYEDIIELLEKNKKYLDGKDIAYITTADIAYITTADDFYIAVEFINESGEREGIRFYKNDLEPTPYY